MRGGGGDADDADDDDDDDDDTLKCHNYLHMKGTTRGTRVLLARAGVTEVQGQGTKRTDRYWTC